MGAGQQPFRIGTETKWFFSEFRPFSFKTP